MAGVRKSISLEEKVRIIELVRKGTKSSDVARQFDLKPSSVYTILKSADKVLASRSVASSTKRIRKPKFETVDQAVLRWFRQQRSLNIPIQVRMNYESISCIYFCLTIFNAILDKYALVYRFSFFIFRVP